MTTTTLYTVQEVARLLHVSDDTVRRQIREGDLEAIRIGTTPKGRPRYRIHADVVEQKLSQSTAAPVSAIDRFREVFAHLDDTEREELIEKAIQWARTRTPEPTGSRGQALSAQEIENRLSPRAKQLLEAAKRR